MARIPGWRQEGRVRRRGLKACHVAAWAEVLGDGEAVEGTVFEPAQTRFGVYGHVRFFRSSRPPSGAARVARASWSGSASWRSSPRLCMARSPARIASSHRPKPSASSARASGQVSASSLAREPIGQPPWQCRWRCRLTMASPQVERLLQFVRSAERTFVTATDQTIAEQAAAVRAGFAPPPPAEIVDAFAAEQASLDAAGLPPGVAEPGTPMPDAKLLDDRGGPTTLAGARWGQAAVVVFYRGAWCPYCNLTLRSYQQQLVPALAARDLSLAERVQAGEGHVPGPDQQGHEVVEQ